MAKKRQDDPTTVEDESLLDEPEPTEDVLVNEAEEESSIDDSSSVVTDDRFDKVVFVDSLDIPELRDFSKVTDDEMGAYRRVPTSIGTVEAVVGNWLAFSSNGIHVLRTDPRTNG